jgi:hypothetical protein
VRFAGFSFFLQKMAARCHGAEAGESIILPGYHAFEQNFCSKVSMKCREIYDNILCWEPDGHLADVSSSVVGEYCNERKIRFNIRSK